MLMITHAVAFYWLVRPQSGAAQSVADNAVASWIESVVFFNDPHEESS
jgi:hypothetical protein